MTTTAHKLLLLGQRRGLTAYQRYINDLLALSPLALWPLSEQSGAVAHDISGNGLHGTYHNATLAATTFPDGSPAPLFDASNERVALPASSINVLFDPTLGEMGCWMRIRTPALWGETVAKNAFHVGADANNRAFLFKQGVANQFDTSYRAGGTTEQHGNTNFAPAGWFYAGIAWDKQADEVYHILNGDIVLTSTSLGDWTGNLSTSFTAIANFTSAGGGTNWWDGYIKYCAIWDRVLTPEERASVVPADFFSVDPGELTETIVVGEGQTFDGQGATYRLPARVAWPAFEVQAGATLQNVRVTATDYSGTGGIHVNGNNATVRNARVDHCTFGIRVDDSDGILIEDCELHHNLLDGIKLRKMVTNWIIRNCNGHHNGQSTTSAGDGIDTYAGGMQGVIEDCDFSDNLGNGITIKTDVGSRDEPEFYGVPTDTTVRRCVCNDNYGNGLTAYAFPLDDETIPLYEGAVFEDCESRRNGNYGILINADDVAATNVECTDNGITDVWIGARSGQNIMLDNVTGNVTDLRE